MILFGLGNWDNLCDFGDLFADVPLDAVLEGHFAAWAAVAGAVEADLHDPGVGDVDQFNIPPIGLNGRTDQVDHALHFLA
jgi:hypothetical protein